MNNGFLRVKEINKSGNTQGSYYYLVKNQKMENNKTATAKRWFDTPAYCIGERRKVYERGQNESTSKTIQ